MLLHKAVAASAGVGLHIGVELLRRRRDLVVLHVAAVVHEEQSLKVERQLIERVLVRRRLYGHGQPICERALWQQGIHVREYAHLGKDAYLVVREDEHVRRRGRVIAHELERIRETGLFLEHYLHIRRGLREIG